MLFTLSVGIGTFLVTYYLIPKVLWIVREKDLYKPVIQRSAHSNATPTLGGVAFFTTFVLVVSMLQSFYVLPTGNHLIAAVTLMFMVGLKDDLVVSTAKVKLIGQLLAAAFIVFSPEMQLTSLYGFMGIHEIPAAIGYLLSAFIVIALVNAYNLIDGINGLAAIIGIVVSTAYGIGFYLIGAPFFTLICVVVIGILLAYLPFNFSRGRKRIFMGDSGSLMIGLVLGFLTIKMLSLPVNIPWIDPGNEPAHRILMVLAVLFIPTFDTARVILIRLWKRQSPFEADANHTHHILLGLRLSHLKSSLLLGALNVLVIVIYSLISPLLTTLWLSLSLVLIYILVFAICEWAATKVLKQKQEKSTRNMNPAKSS